MTAILLESAFVVALVLILAALAVHAFRTFSPTGVRLRQRRNYRALIDDAARTCPVHGPQPPESLVRLDDGTVVCPHCFRQVLYANHDH